MSNLIPNDVEQMHSVKIDYVSTRVEKEDLEKLFGKYGRVGDVYLPSHPNGDRKGFAFVRFYNKQDAEDAVKEMEGYELEGKTLKCMLATVQKGRFNPNVRKGSGRSRSRSRSRRGRRDSRSRRRDAAWTDRVYVNTLIKEGTQAWLLDSDRWYRLRAIWHSSANTSAESSCKSELAWPCCRFY
ncbi:SRSF8 [Symbiodinium sp. CCMP2592]|nr:SRSF8 [Symbiodinium sp. CCMP2592]